MGSLRFGRVTNALSSGIGLFAEKSIQEEQKRMDREWQATLERVREQNLQARQEASFEHRENLAAEQNAAAQSRFETQSADTAAHRSATLSQNESQFSRRQVADSRESLNNNLVRLNESMRKEMEEVFTPEERSGVQRRYQAIKDDAITSTVAWLSSQNLPGFEVKSKRGLQSMLIQMGMDSVGAKEGAEQLWTQGMASSSPSEDNDLFGTGQDQVRYVDFMEPVRDANRIVDQAREGSPSFNAPPEPSIDSPGLFDESVSPQTPIPNLNPLGAGEPERFGRGARQISTLIREKPWIRNQYHRERMGLPPQ